MYVIDPHPRRLVMSSVLFQTICQLSSMASNEVLWMMPRWMICSRSVSPCDAHSESQTQSRHARLYHREPESRILSSLAESARAVRGGERSGARAVRRGRFHRGAARTAKRKRPPSDGSLALSTVNSVRLTVCLMSNFTQTSHPCSITCIN